MKTKFQQEIKKEDLLAVTKMLHPELWKKFDHAFIEKRFSTYCKYSWVCVSFKIREYGNIDFAINNHNCHTLWGRISKERMQQALDNGEIVFKIWRFYGDKLNPAYDGDTSQNELGIPEAGEYIKSKYSLPSVDEYYNNYYSD